MGRLKRNASTIKLLCGANSSLRKAVVEKAKDDLIRCLCDISFNILKGTAPILRLHKNRLAKHKSSLHRLTDCKLPLKKKRKIIQSGGFLSVLLGAAIPLLGSLLGLAK